MDGENRLTADKNAIQNYLCYTDNSTAFCVCCGVCAGFYDRVINVIDKFHVRLSIDTNNLDSKPKLLTTGEWCVAQVTNLFFSKLSITPFLLLKKGAIFCQNKQCGWMFLQSPSNQFDPFYNFKETVVW